MQRNSVPLIGNHVGDFGLQRAVAELSDPTEEPHSGIPAAMVAGDWAAARQMPNGHSLSSRQVGPHLTNLCRGRRRAQAHRVARRAEYVRGVIAVWSDPLRPGEISLAQRLYVRGVLPHQCLKSLADKSTRHANVFEQEL
jgi:hypothetical protein